MLSKDHEELRKLLVKLHGAVTALTVGTVLANYIAKPLAHHVIPSGDPKMDMAKMLIGVPPLPPKQRHQHTRQAERQEGPTPEQQTDGANARELSYAYAIEELGATLEVAEWFANAVAAGVMQGHPYDDVLAAVKKALDDANPAPAAAEPEDAELAELA